MNDVSMTFQPAVSASSTRGEEEAEFGLEEIFFSRTDKRGVIEAFNSVFLRIAGYPADAMMKAPHKIIRHPDMPKGVFHLVWQAIQAGHPFGAYVKNRAQDGRPYWVFAVMTPLNDGYLSVRMKPTSEMRDTVAAEYAALLRREQTENLTPEASAAAFLARLPKLGFDSYAQFQAHAIAQETLARDLGLGNRADPLIGRLLRLLKATAEIRRSRRDMLNLLRRNALTPVNMRILASRIEGAGGPLSAISDNYRIMSDKVAGQLSQFAQDESTASDFAANGIEGALFRHCAARLVSEAVQLFQRDGNEVPQINAADEMARLKALEADYQQQANGGLTNSILVAERTLVEVQTMRGTVMGLDMVRVMCRIENGRIANGLSGGLGAMLDQLDDFQVQVDKRLDDIAAAAQDIGVEGSALTNQRKRQNEAA